MIQVPRTKNELNEQIGYAATPGPRSNRQHLRVRWNVGRERLRRFPPGPSGSRNLAVVKAVSSQRKSEGCGHTFSSLSAALKAKDTYTWNHSLRVGAFAGGIARALGLSGGQITQVRIAGELHDIGKIGVPLELLRKASRLTFKEYLRVMEHPVIGAGMVGPLVPQDSPIAAAVRWHHARYDGQDVAAGRSGGHIPLAARIVAVADAFDAMTSTRPYRIALSLDTALAELNDHSGSQFDPECVLALRELYQTHSGERIRGVAIPA